MSEPTQIKTFIYENPETNECYEFYIEVPDIRDDNQQSPIDGDNRSHLGPWERLRSPQIGERLSSDFTEQTMKTIRGYTEFVINSFKNFTSAEISEIVLEFGVDLKAGVPLLVNMAGSGFLKVQVKCTFPSRTEAQE